MKKVTLLISLVCMLFSACATDIVSEYSNHQCYYIMDFKYGHTASPLHAALNSPNTFCIISTSAETSSSYKLRAEVYGQSVHEETVTSELLVRPRRQLGLGGAVIVGRSSFFDGQLFVFDRQCPNCVKEHRRYNYPLYFRDSQNVRCPECERVYSLLNAGASNDGGEKLYRYHANYAGEQFVISNPQ